MNNYSNTCQEFEQRYKYAYELLDEHYKECFTSDIKTDEWMNKYWLEKEQTLGKVINTLQLCVFDTRYMAGYFDKKLDLIDKQD